MQIFRDFSLYFTFTCLGNAKDVSVAKQHGSLCIDGTRSLSVKNLVYQTSRSMKHLTLILLMSEARLADRLPNE